MKSTSSSLASKRWFIPLLTVVITAAVVGLIFAKRMWVHRNIHVPLQRRAAEMTAELNASGANVGEPQIVDSVKGVEQAIALEINGKEVRLLEFDMANDMETKEIKHIHQDHVTKILGAEQPAEDEGAIVILNFEKHPDKAKILDAFHKSGSGGK